VSFYSGTHPEDPILRNGTNGPELGQVISVGEDVWIGGNAMILPGVTVGRGSVIGAGSVVTKVRRRGGFYAEKSDSSKDVPDFWIAAGNPARLLRKVNTPMDPENPTHEIQAHDRLVKRAKVDIDRRMETRNFEYKDEEQGW
jgi:acetyltransferase-like isoleucine patch superfamily enzyme